jgi:AraC family cel operon transcriptional repressor
MSSIAAPCFRFRHFAAANEAFHLARSVKVLKSPLQLHRHDFAEICWVESGEGSHFLNGGCLPLCARDIFFILPNDCHGLSARATSAMTIVNLAFPATLVGDLRERYFSGERRWFWGDRKAAGCEHLSPSQIARIGRAADLLAFSPRESFPRDWFLLMLFNELGANAQQSGTLPPEAPDWLRHACQAISRPEHFRMGITEFHRLAGKSPEHFARTLKALIRLTPTDYMNRVRLDHAALQLRMSQSPVTQIAYDSGFGNLSHFFHLFRREYSATPSAYRSRRRQDIV